MPHRYRTCEKCYQYKKERSLLKHLGHYVCKSCTRSQGSMRSYLKAEREVWAARRTKRRMITSEEEKVLWQMYEKKLPYSVLKARLKNLKINASAAHKYGLMIQEKNKPTFKEQFQQLTSRKRNNPI